MEAGGLALAANFQDSAEAALTQIRRPWCVLSVITIAAVLITAGGGPLAAVSAGLSTFWPAHSPITPSPPSPSPPAVATNTHTCGDAVCESPETTSSCAADCPGATTPATCGEEPHSDPAGEAVAWGSAPENRVKSAAECCERCHMHAANPKNIKKPCNSWVFCYMPHCWSLDNGNTHTFGECWLKWQVNPKNPLYGQRGKYTDRFRKRHWNLHLSGKMPNGSPRNLTPPTHVPWTGGVMGAHVEYPKVTWQTDIEGIMTSSQGERIVPWRAWESREQNLARGVRAEFIPS
mmetsp:Transcript_60172/g.99843  ORF Transcript_60172/g.99843 Transcript_60172/m.99843 type:complete len:291 (-) Transcript_60172:227-1099(-)